MKVSGMISRLGRFADEAPPGQVCPQLVLAKHMEPLRGIGFCVHGLMRWSPSGAKGRSIFGALVIVFSN